jgi:hypothetical protein
MILLGAGVKVNGRTRWRIRDQMVRELDVHDGGAFAIACEHDIACFVSEPGLRGLRDQRSALVCGEDIVDAAPLTSCAMYADVCGTERLPGTSCHA